MRTITSKIGRYDEDLMTASDLISLLQKVPPDTPVIFEWEGQLLPGYTDTNTPVFNTTLFDEPVLILNADG